MKRSGSEGPNELYTTLFLTKLDLQSIRRIPKKPALKIPTLVLATRVLLILEYNEPLGN